MSEQCKQKVYDKSGWHPYQCTRNAVQDGFCKQHHPDSVKARQDKSYAEYKARLAIDPYNLAIKRAEKAEHQRDALLRQLKETLTEAIGWYDDSCGYDEGDEIGNEFLGWISRSRQLIAEIEEQS